MGEDSGIREAKPLECGALSPLLSRAERAPAKRVPPRFSRNGFNFNLEIEPSKTVSFGVHAEPLYAGIRDPRRDSP
jgi:hypothetical protein